jgi:hypothetical protein
MRIGYWWESQREETTRKTKMKVGGYIKMDLGEVERGDVDWIGLA